MTTELDTLHLLHHLNDSLQQCVERANDLFHYRPSGSEALGTLMSSSGSKTHSSATLAFPILGASRNRLPARINNSGAWRPPPSIRPTFPPEVLDNVILFLPFQKRVALLSINSVFYHIAVRRVYHTLKGKEDRCLSKFVKLLHTLSKNPALPPLVRVMEFNIANSEPTIAFYRLLRYVLQRSTGLLSLSLEFPRSQCPPWVLDGCTFRLKQFTTSIPYGSPLAEFLNSQPGIVELTLRGLLIDSAAFLPFLDVKPQSENLQNGPFVLEPSALPNLRNFNTIHGVPPLIRAIMTGRPVEFVSVPLFSSHSLETLEALQCSSKSLRKLSVISFDSDAPSFLFEQLSKRFPSLEALHMVMLMTNYSKALLEGAADFLADFKVLRYITFMAAPGENSSEIEEREIAKQWHKACPSLKTIILPEGKLWIQGESERGLSEPVPLLSSEVAMES